MDRWQKQVIAQDLAQKMVFVAGPRQVGKTTLAKSFQAIWPDLYYLNFDSDDDRQIILKQGWDRDVGLVVLDEIHKLKKWKTKLKGVYDTEGIPPHLLVTGSARLDIYRRGGDSLAGRYFLHRLYPLSPAELRLVDSQLSPKDFDQLIHLGGFPEPFLGGSEVEAARWRKQHLERIVRIDVQDLEPVRDINSLLLLIDLLKQRVGQPISFANLAKDLEVSPHTVKKWVQTLENMYLIFLVRPYHKNLARAHLKQPKIYFYDSGSVLGDFGAKFENTVAYCLRKWLHYLEDTQGKTTKLFYLRDKEKREVDFVIVIDGKIKLLIEAKTSKENVTKALWYYHQRLVPEKSIQLIYDLKKRQTLQGINLEPAYSWLADLDA